jgi:hypothetical protein
LLVILIFNFALELDAKSRALSLGSVVGDLHLQDIGLNRSMAMEKDRAV